MSITTKDYKCDKCGAVKQIKTNHDGSFRGCDICRDKRATLVCQTEAGIERNNKRQAEKQTLRATLPQSILSTTSQKKQYEKSIEKGTLTMIVNIRWDDTCANNHNSFGITADIYEGRSWRSGGCQHDAIIEYFPEFKHLINWHYFNSDGYEYVENIIYHAKNGDIEAAKRCANWDDATMEQLLDKDVLMARLPSLMEQLKSDIESLGFIY